MTGKGTDSESPSGWVDFFSLVIGTITPHSQLRQFILGSLVVLSLTRRPLLNISDGPIKEISDFKGSDTYQALSDRLALPTYAQVGRSVSSLLAVFAG